ncbi:unnamed protein product [Arabis nemorensis]|uniref:Uncharacterized protein n=1 Tax=Arabis nemorensis TaxID=586526 RepID=A0A565CR56_9BRAS|nr:unnamed protein product [Arabis nemorensis]
MSDVGEAVARRRRTVALTTSFLCHWSNVMAVLALIFFYSGHHMKRKTMTVGPGASLLCFAGELGLRQPLLVFFLSLVRILSRKYGEDDFFNLCSAVGSQLTIEHIPARRKHQSRSGGSRNFSGVPRRTIFSNVVLIHAGNSLCPPELMPSPGILRTQSPNMRNTRFDLAPTSSAPPSSSPSIHLPDFLLLLPSPNNPMTYFPLGPNHKWAWPNQNEELPNPFRGPSSNLCLGPIVLKIRFAKIIYVFELIGFSSLRSLKFFGFSNPVIYSWWKSSFPPSSNSLRLVVFSYLSWRVIDVPSFMSSFSKSHCKVTNLRFSGFVAKTLLTHPTLV